MGFDEEDELGTVPDDETRSRLPIDRSGAGIGVPDTSNAALSSRVAAPGVAKEMPAASLRGLGAVAPNPDESTSDLESRGLASRISPAPIAAPSATQSRTAADQAEVDRLARTGSGISQIHNPFGRYALRGLETIGNVLSPATMMMIPGTEAHHNLLEKTARGRVGEDTIEAGKEAEAAKAQAEANKANAEAKVAGNPKEGLTPEEVTIHDLMTGNNGQPRINPKTQQPYTYFDAYTDVMQAKADTKPETHAPIGKDSATQYNARILRELKVNPKTTVDTLPPEYEVKETDTDAQAKAKLEAAKDLVTGAAGQQHITVSTGNQANARSDKSYQFNSTQLEKLRAPVEQRMDRMSTLLPNINLKSPQADSLLAPEILSVVAGGQGSGLRMNEAELSRIAGGATKWTELKTALNKWSLDPNHATFTDEQRQQMFQIAQLAAEKYQKKLDILNAAEQSLLESEDPKQHRAITAKAKKDLDAIDKGINQNAENQNAGEPERPANVPANYVYQKNGPKGEGWYKP